MENTPARSIYNTITEHIFIAFFISTIPAMWLTAVELLGPVLGFYIDKTPYLKPFITVTVFISLGVCIVYNFLKGVGDKYNLVIHRRGINVLTKLIAGVNQAKINKYFNLINFIKRKTGDFFCQNLGPAEQILYLLEHIRTPLAEIFGIAHEQIGLRVLYKFTQDAKWDIVRTVNIENELTLKEIITNHETTEMQLFRSKKATIFFPDKRIAHANNQYFYGPKDHGKGEIGSILCHEVSIKRSKTYVKAAFSMISYGKQLCKTDDLESKSKIINLVLPTIANRIKVELATLYISEIKQCSKCVI